MDAASPSSSSSDSLLLQNLIARGWRFRDMDRIRGLITAQLSISASLCTVDSVESELLDMDLRSIGGKCLPEPSLLFKTSHLQGPIVLQVCSSRDISRSSVADASGNSGSRRLLQLKLTDGQSEITAVERSHVPSIPDDISPGTKVRLQSKADIYGGILCLNQKVITVLGGVVQSLYEEWQLKRKYLDVTRYALRLSQENPSNCPPPFEKLQVRAPVRGTAAVLYPSANKGTNSSSDPAGFSGPSSNDRGESLATKGECFNLSRTVQVQKNNVTMERVADDVKLLHTVGENTEKPTCSAARPKVTASVPVQNQVAAQKLLQKTSEPNFKDRNSRSQRHRGKFKEDDSTLITLDEWERRKTGVDPLTTHGHSDISQDEDLARQLQRQFELEDIHAQKGSNVMEAKNITMSMFSFERDDARNEFRGRGTGKGRGRRTGGRGRGRGRVQH
ncbi:hypothetical protein DH2020_010734 [Rehmannia glutinosa]|uniref:RecQ mediated genome instability protein 1 OB-fold domain-containing protein n=1 Tax=Rehmannia glutinosa TaxID=99300 RepID=A0ABR0XBI4_REHGL